MRATDPRAKDKQESERPESTGKAYERMVEDLFMGGDEDEEPEGSDEDDTE